MPFIQNMKIPTPKKFDFRFTRFEGGLNNKVSPLELQPNESPRLLNVIFNEIGSFETRPGLFKYASNQIPKTVYRIFKYETNDFKYLLLSTNTGLYRLPYGGNSFTLVKSTNNVVNGFQKEDKFYFVDGNKYYEYDGTTVYRIENPLSTLQISGELVYKSNMYSYNVRFASPSEIHLLYKQGWDLPNIANPFEGWYVEVVSGRGFQQKRVISEFVRETSTSTATLTYADKLTMKFTGDDSGFPKQPDGYYNTYTIIIPAKDSRPKQTRIITQYYGEEHKVVLDKPLDYIPSAGERMQVMKRGYILKLNSELDITPDTTSTVVISRFDMGTINIDDVYKIKTYTPTALEFADPFKGYNEVNILKDAKDMVLHKNRIWFTLKNKANNIFYTDLDNQYYLPTNHFITSISNDGDEIVALVSFNDVLVIFKHNSIFALYGDSKDNFTLKQINVASGAFNKDVIQQVGNYLFYLGSDGKVYALYDVRTDTQKMLTKCISQQLDLMREPINIDINRVENAMAVYLDNMYILAIDDKILVYNVLYGSWLLWDNINPTAMFVYENQLLLTNTHRYLYRMPFKPFYVEESFSIGSTPTTIITVNKGYIDEVGKNCDVYVGSTLINPENITKINNTTIEIPPTSNATVYVKYTSEVCYNDQENGSYNVVYHTKDNDFEYPNKRKKLRKIFVTARAYKWFSSTIQIKGLIDCANINTDVDITNQISLFGRAKFGNMFIDRNVVKSEPITINQRGYIIRFVIEMECEDNPINIYEINGEYELL